MSTIQDQILQKRRELELLKGIATAPQQNKEIVMALDDRNSADVNKMANKVSYPTVAVKWSGAKALSYLSTMGYNILIVPGETVKVPAADVVVLSKFYDDGKGPLKFISDEEFDRKRNKHITKEDKLRVSPEAITPALVKLPDNLPPEVLAKFAPFLSEEARTRLQAAGRTTGQKVAQL